jgi:hypothetical protein
MKPPANAKLAWAPQEGPQTALLSCPVGDVFFGGARGGGKSDGLLGDMLAHADRHGEGARGVIFRKTNSELEELQERAQEIYPKTGATYAYGLRKWVWPNGATLKMRFLLYDKDAGKYKGHSYTWVGFDEADDWPSPIPIDKLRACLRSAKGIPSFLRVAGNPGGVGHNWLKMRYIDPASPRKPFYGETLDPITEQVVKTQRVFIPSLLDDNKILMANDPDYWKNVIASATGNPELLKAWRYGLWNITAGGAFDDLWNTRPNPPVVEPFEVPFSWRIDRCLDWGSAKPFSVQWWAESDGSECPNGVSYPPGTLFLINEWYGWQKGQPNVGLRLSIKQVAEGIHEREDEWKLTGRVKSGPADLPVTPEGESIGVLASC